MHNIAKRCIRTLVLTEHSCNDYVCLENYYNLVVYHHTLTLFNHECDVKKYIFPSRTYSIAVENFVIAIVPRTCWVVQNHKIGASDEISSFLQLNIQLLILPLFSISSQVLYFEDDYVMKVELAVIHIHVDKSPWLCL
jgi:proteasome lid subunit RPN8/RPN11